jgi:hypothetical protein
MEDIDNMLLEYYNAGLYHNILNLLSIKSDTKIFYNEPFYKCNNCSTDIDHFLIQSQCGLNLHLKCFIELILDDIDCICKNCWDAKLVDEIVYYDIFKTNFKLPFNNLN